MEFLGSLLWGPHVASWSLWSHQLTVGAYAIVRRRYETIPINLSSMRKTRAILLCAVFDRGINSIGKLLLFSLGHDPIVRESCETAGFHSKLL